MYRLRAFLLSFALMGCTMHDSFAPHAQLVQAPASGTKVIEAFQLRGNGHYFLLVSINDEPAPFVFVIDTGAYAVSIGSKTAHELGIRLDDLPNIEILSVGGLTIAKSATLRRMRIGSVEFKNVPILITPGLGEMNLFGLPLLRYFTRWGVEDGSFKLKVD
jgi:aspartyl protease family protein